MPEFEAATADLPGAIFVINQRSLFQRGRGQGRNIDVDITGPELEELIARGARVFGEVNARLPEAQARPIPSLDLGNPEVRVLTHRRRAAELGLTNAELGFAVSALVDGAKASDYQYRGKEIDLRLMAEPRALHRTHLLEQLPIATPDGSLVTLGSVAQVDVVNGPVQINHRERQRVITIQVTPDERMPLEAAMEIVRDEILEPMEDEGLLGGVYQARLSGAADKLMQTAKSVRWNLLLALVITYLLLAALFESFLYPLVILFSVPLAAFGGFLGLALVNTAFETPTNLDVLTMLGFVILIGIVVNNAILIVHQAADLHERQHVGVWHGPARAVSRSGLGALSWPRKRRGRRPDRLDHLHAVPGAGSVEPGARPARDGASGARANRRRGAPPRVHRLTL